MASAETRTHAGGIQRPNRIIFPPVGLSSRHSVSTFTKNLENLLEALVDASSSSGQRTQGFGFSRQ
jgi:hypothetical protein